MIIDAITRGGDRAYFDFRAIASAPIVSAKIPTEPLGFGKAYAISGISIQLEAADLRPLFGRQPVPILKVSVHKEMFPDLFAAPYEHRVHNISGYEDFNRGNYLSCKAIDVEGVPTIVSVGDGENCIWTSPVYQMPESIVIDKIAWDLAVSRLTPSVNFTYGLELRYWVTDLNPQNQRSHPVIIGANPTQARNVADLGLSDTPVAYAIIFSATINSASNIYEAHATDPFDTLGAPLLRAVYIVEKIVPAFYEFYSLKELLDHCVDCHLFETPGPAITKLTATIALSALLVQSDNQRAANAPTSQADDYEYLELGVTQKYFTSFEARAVIRETITPPKPIPS